jgi:CRISPR-associated protein Csb2
MAILDESGGVPWLVSGHAPDKSPVKRDHLAIIPLAETGRYQDGSIAGLALVVPNREKTPDLRQEIERLEDALPQIGPFILGEITRITPTLVEQPMSRTLASSTWDGYSHKWASVTPVAVPHMGGDSLAEDIARLCAQAGLPSVTIDVDDRSFFLGEYPPAGLIRQYDKGGSFRHAYVRLKFEHEVEGPIGLGAGRYQGYGWFRRYTGGRNGD